MFTCNDRSCPQLKFVKGMHAHIKAVTSLFLIPRDAHT